MFIFIFEGREGQRERGTEDPKQAVCWQRKARCGAWIHEPWNRDLSWSDAWPTESPRRPRTQFVVAKQRWMILQKKQNMAREVGRRKAGLLYHGRGRKRNWLTCQMLLWSVSWKHLLDAVIQERAFSWLGGPFQGKEEARTQAGEDRGVRQKVRKSRTSEIWAMW